MMTFEIIGQKLVLSSPLVVEGSIDYLTAEFLFHDADWRGADKWAHFTKTTKTKTVEWDINILDDRIDKEAHLNLDSGTWKVFVHGSTLDGTRITTDEVEIEVSRTGMRSYGVLEDVPLSDAEQISLVAEDARNIAQAVRDDADAGKFDGYSPKILVTEEEDGHRVFITQKDGDVQQFDVKDGFDPTLAVTPITGGHRVRLVDREGVDTFDVMDGYTPQKGVDYFDGDPGYTPQKGIDYNDGVSPVVSVTDTTNGHEVFVTDASGTETFEVKNGAKGDPGFSPIVSKQVMDGYTNVFITDSTHTETIKVENGADGVSPTVETSEFSGGHTVKITDKDGAKTFNVMNGKDGRDGSIAIPAPVNFGHGTISSNSKNLNSMAYGNGRFIMVGVENGENVVMITSDFVHYNRVVLTERWRRIRFVNNMFILIGRVSEYGMSEENSTIKYSVDGEKWTEVTMPATAYWSDIDYGEGYYVAVSGFGGTKSDITAYSNDLSTWFQVTMPVSEAWQNVKYGTGWFLAITYSGTQQAVFTVNNKTWTVVPGFGEGYFSELYFHNGKFYIPVDGGLDNPAGEVLIGNAMEWEKKTLPVATNCNSMAFGAGYIMVFASNTDGITKAQDAYYSADEGETWEHIAMPEKSSRASAAYGRGTFACLGTNIELCYLWDNL